MPSINFLQCIFEQRDTQSVDLSNPKLNKENARFTKYLCIVCIIMCECVFVEVAVSSQDCVSSSVFIHVMMCMFGGNIQLSLHVYSSSSRSAGEIYMFHDSSERPNLYTSDAKKMNTFCSKRLTAGQLLFGFCGSAENHSENRQFNFKVCNYKLEYFQHSHSSPKLAIITQTAAIIAANPRTKPTKIQMRAPLASMQPPLNAVSPFIYGNIQGLCAFGAPFN